MYLQSNLPSIPYREAELGRKFSRYALTKEAVSLLRRDFRDVDVKILPGLSSSHSNYDDFLTELSSFKEPEPVMGADGLSTGYAPSRGLQRVRAKPGSTILPLSFAHKQYVDIKSEPDGDDLYIRCIRIATKVCFKKHMQTLGRINKESNIGFPFGTRDVELKAKIASVIINDIDEILSIISNDKLELLYRKYRMLFISHSQVRRQTDKYGKRRDFIMYESSKDNPITIKNTLGHLQVDNLRTRVVYAFNAIANIFITMCIEGYRKYMDVQYSMTFKHRGKDDILRKLRAKPGSFYMGIDYAKYDTTIPFYAIWHFINSIDVDDAVKKAMLLLITSPHYCSNDGRGYPLLDFDPLDNVDKRVYRGLPSGVAFTSVCGKILNMAFVLASLAKIRKTNNDSSLEKQLEALLLHQDEVACLNMSDDMIIFGRESMVRNLYKTMREYGIYEIEQELPVGFLGWSIYRNSNGELDASLSLASYAEGTWIPERDWDNPIFRPYAIWGMGLRRSKEIYGTNPQLLDFMIHERNLARKFFHVDLPNLEQQYITYPSSSPKQLDSYKHIVDPSRILWDDLELEDSELFKDFLDNIVYTIPCDHDTYSKFAEKIGVKNE